ncbi:TIGR03086 family metal-binding protein [Mycobacterium asiaticum]|uniref:TIGR03086 family protein n=1 Tax=Mycobacterium asiaticum TaxID=1790 RepID=A0A1A3N7T2_MYCAS|nr:TIGR03086 family metal-binding protein [Mycobacterium asiaticum]OBK17129.1 TIGR03086 family protein [Mycobacterium asiaticum]
MPPDLRPGPDSPPLDELHSAEDSLAVLQHVLHTIAGSDKDKQTPCSEYNVKQLTTHLLNSIVTLGGMVGADIAVPEDTDSVEGLVIAAARPALDAWHKHGLEGEVPFGDGAIPARAAVAVFSIEFLVHGWDYARAVGSQINPPDSLSEYVLGLAQNIIQPPQRQAAGFDDPVRVADDAPPLDRLLAFTGRNPA